MIRSAGRKNTADCSGAYQVALRDAPIKSELGSGCFEQSCQLSWDQARNGYHTRWRSGWGSADRPDRGVHGEINSNSSNDDNGVPGDSDACIAAADRNNPHRVGCSKPGVEHNKQVAHR